MNLYRGFLSPRNEKPLVRVRSGISISEFVNSPDFLPHDDQFHDKFLWVSPSLKYATGIATTRYIGYILTNWNDPGRQEISPFITTYHCKEPPTVYNVEKNTVWRHQSTETPSAQMIAEDLSNSTIFLNRPKWKDIEKLDRYFTHHHRSSIDSLLRILAPLFFDLGIEEIPLPLEKEMDKMNIIDAFECVVNHFRKDLQEIDKHRLQDYLVRGAFCYTEFFHDFLKYTETEFYEGIEGRPNGYKM